MFLVWLRPSALCSNGGGSCIHVHSTGELGLPSADWFLQAWATKLIGWGFRVTPGHKSEDSHDPSHMHVVGQWAQHTGLAGSWEPKHCATSKGGNLSSGNFHHDFCGFACVCHLRSPNGYWDREVIIITFSQRMNVVLLFGGSKLIRGSLISGNQESFSDWQTCDMIWVVIMELPNSPILVFSKVTEYSFISFNDPRFFEKKKKNVQLNSFWDHAKLKWGWIK